MRQTTKLLPVLLLGSALGGCSMAGTGDYFADEYSNMQQTQMPHYWGASPSACNPEQPQQVAQQQYRQQPACAVSYPVAHGQFEGHTFAAPTQQNFGQAPQTYAGQPVYLAQGHQEAQGFQGQPVYNGQQVYAPASHVNPRSNPSKGLRQSYTYGTLGATLYDVDNESFGIQGRLGWQSKNIFGAEIEGSFGVNDESDTVDLGAGPLDVDTGIDTQIAAFAVARLPVSNRFNVFSRVGYHNTEIDVEVDDGITVIEDTVSTDGIAYGVGAEYAFDPKTSIRADYTRYDFDGPDADAVSLAIARKF